MENEEKKEKTQKESELSAGEKFWEKLMNMPYTNDRVGQVFVRTFKGQYPVNKDDANTPSTEETSGTK